MTAEGRFTFIGKSTIAAVGSVVAVGRQIDRGAGTFAQTSGFSAEGGLKWEEEIVATTSYTDQTPATTTWTDQSVTTTTWTDAA